MEGEVAAGGGGSFCHKDDTYLPCQQAVELHLEELLCAGVPGDARGRTGSELQSGKPAAGPSVRLGSMLLPAQSFGPSHSGAVMSSLCH